jgi:cellulose synthase/poly-beta-1,6-N-acetylglucosamine synthase-like glycosyltransferase
MFLWPYPSGYPVPGIPRYRALWSADFPQPADGKLRSSNQSGVKSSYLSSHFASNHKISHQSLVKFIAGIMNTIFFQYFVILIKGAYIVCAAILFLYGINSLILSLIYLLNRKKIWVKKKLPKMKSWPFISIQLPLYNEGRLVNNTLHFITQLDYPREKLQIQVLDDSTDDTRILLKDLVEKYRKEGFWIEYTHRTDRIGFKAGNLASGLKKSKGEFIIIFDADYEPHQDFLRKTIPLFIDERIGFVQTRWTNTNLNSNIITYMGGIAYDGHLFVEQNARSISGLFVGFSGSGGIWRKSCLLSIDGWKSDSVTEDIDISFRAQLNGWKGVYEPQSLSRAELPEDMDAYKLQQNRWAKGSAQCFRKYIKQVFWTRLPIKVKVMAFLHLLSYVTIPAMPILLLLVLPICLYGGGFITLFWWMALGSIGPALTFTIAQLEQKGQLTERLLHLPIVLLMAVGISLDAFAGVLSGLFQKGGEFIRTPRVSERGISGEKNRKVTFLTNLTLAEIFMGGYLICSVFLLWSTIGKYLAPWLLSSASGYLLMAGASTIQYFSQQKRKILSQEKQ